ncbi:MAG: glutathione S-transferase family protein [Chromatiales bacterium]|jgi:glutathione S-transferase|nr:glutathione S-transferase family protein [Chromatiales bacterium]
MLLYDASSAPNPRRVRIFLAEKGIEVPMQSVDIAGMENRKGDYLAKNPLAGVPMLELDDGTCITETVAICRYFEALNPAPALFGATPLEQALVEMWNRRAELALMQPVSAIFQHSHAFFKERIEQVPAYADACKRTVAARLAWLEKEMSDRDYLAGQTFSVADITALCAIDFAKVSKIRLGDEHPLLRAWYARVAGRASAAA